MVLVILLSFNSKSVIERTVRAAQRISPHVLVVDSGSTDGTVELLQALGCEVVHRAFQNYADQRNWAIDQFGSRAAWQLHLDADEVLDEQAIASVTNALADPGPFAGFMLERLTYFMGKPLRYGGARSWHLRLFRSGAGRCEDRLYDQHFICEGQTKRLAGYMHDMNVGNLTEWVARHNRWSNLEAAELCKTGIDATGTQVAARLSEDPRERRRFYKGLYYRAPRLLRALAYFFFRYGIQLGFLDGKVGFLYAFLQALWFRVLVDAKLIELEMQERAAAGEVKGA